MMWKQTEASLWRTVHGSVAHEKVAAVQNDDWRNLILEEAVAAVELVEAGKACKYIY